MSDLRLRKFSDLAFIQSIDKERILRPLLEPFADYFGKHDVDVSALADGNGVDRKLLAIFTEVDGEMPRQLLNDLYMLDDLADESGHDRIRTEAQKSGVTLDGIGDELSPAEFAIAVYRKEPELIRGCHERIAYRKIKKYVEFQAAEDAQLSLRAALRKRTQIRSQLGSWFKELGRSEVCEVHVYEEDGEIKFQVTHGKTYRSEGTIEKDLGLARVAYRPQKHDSIIYDNRTCVLKVNAQWPAEVDKYRRTFGEVLFDDEDRFPDGNIYTLDPLKRPGFAIKLVEGVDAARMVEVCVENDDEGDGFVQLSKSADLLKRAHKSGHPNLAAGAPVRAAFLIKYSSGGRVRRLELRPPNVAIYDRERDGAPTERFLAANGLMKLDGGNDHK